MQGNGLKLIFRYPNILLFILLMFIPRFSLVSSVVPLQEPPPDISGRWRSNIGLVYTITQEGSRFQWRVAENNQVGNGSITGRELHATWQGERGMESARGEIVDVDRHGRATRIEWSNGVVFMREDPRGREQPFREEHPEQGWCCAEGRIFPASEHECRERRGVFFLSRAEAERECRETGHETGWCCREERVFPVSELECREQGGRFFPTREEAEEACQKKYAETESFEDPKVYSGKEVIIDPVPMFDPKELEKPKPKGKPGKMKVITGFKVLTPGTIPAIDPKKYYRIVAKCSNKCLDLNLYEKTKNGGNIQQWSCNNQYQQQWKITPVGNGYYRITSRLSGKCLDVVRQNINKIKANIQQWACHGGDNQLWRIVPVGNGYYKFFSKASGKCMDVQWSGKKDGVNVWQWDSSGSDAQKWRLIPIK